MGKAKHDPSTGVLATHVDETAGFWELNQQVEDILFVCVRVCACVCMCMCISLTLYDSFKEINKSFF